MEDCSCLDIIRGDGISICFTSDCFCIGDSGWSEVGDVGVGTLWKSCGWVSIFRILVICLKICRHQKTVKNFIYFYISVGFFFNNYVFVYFLVPLLNFPFEDYDNDSFIGVPSFIFGADSEGYRSFFQDVFIVDFDLITLKLNTLR